MDEETSREIKALKDRNSRVEGDKAWETSLARKAVISTFTYALSVLILLSIGAPQPFFNAAIPALGFLLSTMTFGMLKESWITGYNRKRGK
jgi:hypothetical protein